MTDSASDTKVRCGSKCSEFGWFQAPHLFLSLSEHRNRLGRQSFDGVSEALGFARLCPSALSVALALSRISWSREASPEAACSSSTLAVFKMSSRTSLALPSSVPMGAETVVLTLNSCTSSFRSPHLLVYHALSALLLAS